MIELTIATAIITDAQRERGDTGPLVEATEALQAEALKALEAWPAGQGVKLSFILELEFPEEGSAEAIRKDLKRLNSDVIVDEEIPT